MSKLLKLLKKEQKLQQKYNNLLDDFVGLDRDCGREVIRVQKKLRRLDLRIGTAMRQELSNRLGDRYEVHVFDTAWQ